MSDCSEEKTSTCRSIGIPRLRFQWYGVVFLLSAFLFSCAKYPLRKPEYDYSKMDKTTRTVHKRVEKFLQTCFEKNYPVKIPGMTRIDSLKVDRERKHLDIFLNRFFGYIPFREKNIARVYQYMNKMLGRKFRKYSFTIYAGEIPVEALIPNYFRSDESRYDITRMPKVYPRPEPVVRNISKPYHPTRGLNGRNIALWHSHGWYYEQKVDRWEWQRARLFQTVEDLGPIQFTLPYLIPMLENAGANVFLPRERDFQTHEVIVDNDSSLFTSSYLEEVLDSTRMWFTGDTAGFAIGEPPYEQGENPFLQGTYRWVSADTFASAVVRWIPDIPAAGEYAISIAYVSLENSVSDAHYSVYHTGGKTDFLVNQRIGGGTWIYLGRFKFAKGSDPAIGRVELSNLSKHRGGIITADAVRFGGGMGNVARNHKISGRPRFVEAARYYLQYAGMPDTLVFSLNGEEDDYKDDYQCRGEWVNYLRGAPFGPNKNRQTKGLGIPIDLSLAFHTDAGITAHDTVIGTLLIYSSNGADSTRYFPDGVSRLANRDFADLLQTQIVEDIRARYDLIWNRRGMWDSDYSEAYRPNVPAALLELLSHQNFLDVKFFHDPRFRFDVSRAIYKAMLKFLATEYRFPYVVQPLPVTHFQAEFSGEREVTLSWRPALDTLEETAVPEKYIVYTRIENRGFDNGTLVDQSQITISNLQPGMIYSFKVTAVNAGGESFPSEILAVCWVNKESPVLIVNGFDRVSGPAAVAEPGFSGFLNLFDQGVPDRYELGFTGMQFDFDPASKWLDDDAPGHGASYANFETKIIPGNTFDFPYWHGLSIRSAGRSFVSASDEAVEERLVDLHRYLIVDIIFGEEKETDWPKPKPEKLYRVFSPQLQEVIREYCSTGGNLFLSGAYVGMDLFKSRDPENPDVKFGKEVLHYFWRTNHAARTGRVYPVDSTFIAMVSPFTFNTGYDPEIYTAEAPDAIEPAHPRARTIFRYSENNMSAAVAYSDRYKLVAFGFPFETILRQEDRDRVMKAVLMFLAPSPLLTPAIEKGRR